MVVGSRRINWSPSAEFVKLVAPAGVRDAGDPVFLVVIEGLVARRLGAAGHVAVGVIAVTCRWRADRTGRGQRVRVTGRAGDSDVVVGHDVRAARAGYQVLHLLGARARRVDRPGFPVRNWATDLAVVAQDGRISRAAVGSGPGLLELDQLVVAEAFGPDRCGAAALGVSGPHYVAGCIVGVGDVGDLRIGQQAGVVGAGDPTGLRVQGVGEPCRVRVHPDGTAAVARTGCSCCWRHRCCSRSRPAAGRAGCSCS